MSETVQLKHCPICIKDLPVSEFGRNVYYSNRGARDSRHIYCKSCVREKVNNFRAGRQNWRHVKRERQAKIIQAMLVAPQPETRIVKPPSEKVLEAIASGNRTQKEIKRETKLTKDEIGDALANLLLWTGEIRTQVIDDTRLYFLNQQEEKVELNYRPAIPFAELVRGSNQNKFAELRLTDRAA